MAHAPVPFMDLAALHAPLHDAMMADIDAVIRECGFALGPAVTAFEAEFGEWLGGTHAVGVSSGTAALHLALLCAGIGPGDEVITTPMTWISTAWAISYVGATPVFVDVDRRHYGLDPAAVAAAITPRTRALLPVHLYGHPADMGALVDVARAHDLVVIEDSAQAHGARYRDRPCGTLADIAAFSFYPGKNLGALGEAGMITTTRAEWAARARRLRDHAQDGRHHHTEIGYNYRMDGIQAAALRIKLRYVDQWNAHRRTVAAQYDAALAGIPGLVRPQPAPWATPCWHLYVVQHAARDTLHAALAAAGIGSAVHYPTPVHLQPAYAHLGYRRGDLPVAEALADRVLSLPMDALRTPAEVARVAAACATNGVALV